MPLAARRMGRAGDWTQAGGPDRCHCRYRRGGCAWRQPPLRSARRPARRPGRPARRPQGPSLLICRAIPALRRVGCDGGDGTWGAGLNHNVEEPA